MPHAPCSHPDGDVSLFLTPVVLAARDENRLGHSRLVFDVET